MQAAPDLLPRTPVSSRRRALDRRRRAVRPCRPRPSPLRRRSASYAARQPPPRRRSVVSSNPLLPDPPPPHRRLPGPSPAAATSASDAGPPPLPGLSSRSRLRRPRSAAGLVLGQPQTGAGFITSAVNQDCQTLRFCPLRFYTKRILIKACGPGKRDPQNRNQTGP